MVFALLEELEATNIVQLVYELYWRRESCNFEGALGYVMSNSCHALSFREHPTCRV